ncbi:hypothetical protein ACVR1G_05000 [Streptococcus dentasini]
MKNWFNKGWIKIVACAMPVLAALYFMFTDKFILGMVMLAFAVGLWEKS